MVPLRSAVLLGATGLVGSELLALLAGDPGCEGVVTIGRRAPAKTYPTLKAVTADLARPETYREYLGVDCVFSALGTTIKKAGSEAAFRRVDYDYPLTVAREAKEAGARRFVLVSSVGADSKSRIFYSRVKGELEDALRGLGFPRGVRILRPSLLLGERGESRPAERVAATVMRVTGGLFVGGLQKYRAIDVADVARAMVSSAKSDGDDAQVYEGPTLFAAAQKSSAQPQV